MSPKRENPVSGIREPSFLGKGRKEVSTLCENDGVSPAWRKGKSLRISGRKGVGKRRTPKKTNFPLLRKKRKIKSPDQRKWEKKKSKNGRSWRHGPGRVLTLQPKRQLEGATLFSSKGGEKTKKKKDYK